MKYLLVAKVVVVVVKWFTESTSNHVVLNSIPALSNLILGELSALRHVRAQCTREIMEEPSSTESLRLT